LMLQSLTNGHLKKMIEAGSLGAEISPKISKIK